jgi:hypothetical protein
MSFSFPRIINGEELDRLQEDNARMAAELAEWQELGPYLEIGRLLQAQVVELLNTDATATEVGELAFKNVMAEEVEKGRADLAVMYQRQHRQTLYARMVEKVAETEGPDILASVMSRLDTDVELATSLRASARKEQEAKARGIVKDHVSAEQEHVLAVETERLMRLDKIDVRFALTGQVELDDSISELLMPGDKLDVMFKKDSLGQAGVRLSWASDINGTTGWVIGGPILTARNNRYKNVSRVEIGGMPKDRFVTVGAQMPDLSAGRTAFKPNTIRQGYPLAFLWHNNRGGEDDSVVKTNVCEGEYANTLTPKVPPVATIDFQTRDIDFTKQGY